jgi:very-short-patch-repair endonuclease
MDLHQSSKEVARKLRKNTTASEKIFWEAVRRKQLNGLRFLRQYRIHIQNRFFVADFACPSHRLVVELDGSIHLVEHIQKVDEERQNLIESLGWKFLRFKNAEIYGSLPWCLERIVDFCDKEDFKPPQTP